MSDDWIVASQRRTQNNAAALRADAEQRRPCQTVRPASDVKKGKPLGMPCVAGPGGAFSPEFFTTEDTEFTENCFLRDLCDLSGKNEI
jgi:hypothetical protein